MIADRHKGSIVSFRNDRMGARFLSILNAIRLSKDYDVPYFFTWMTHGRASEELQSPLEIFDEAYFKEYFMSKEDFAEVDSHGTDFSAFPIGMDEARFRTSISDGTTYVCMATELFVLPWESADIVAKSYSDAVRALRFSPAVEEAMKLVDGVLSDQGIAFHVRRGDIIYDPITSNQIWSNKYIPREFYEVFAERLTKDSKLRVLVFSDEPKEIERLQKFGTNVLSPDSVLPKGLTLAQRDFMEIYAMSRCRQIVGPPGSGFSISAGLMGNTTVSDVRHLLSSEEHSSAMERLVDRLRSDRDVFLSEGDIAQSLPFAVDFLNAIGKSKDALELLETVIDDGVKKTFVFRLLLEQQLRCDAFSSTETTLTKMKSADIDTAIPARLEIHWSDLWRLKALGSVHSKKLDQVPDELARAIWFHPTSRAATNMMSRLSCLQLLALGSFPIPIDTKLRRPAMQVPAPEGHFRLYVPQDDAPNFVYASDLLVWDWSIFLGKTLVRGFNSMTAKAQRRDLFVQQFARHCPEEAVASGLGVYAFALGEFEEAGKQQEAALRTAPNTPLYLKRLANVRLANDPTDPIALVLLEKAAHLAPKNSLFQAELATCLINQGQVERGLKILKTVSHSPNVLPEVPFLTARYMRQKGQDRQEAVEILDRALAIAPHVKRFMHLRVHLLADLKNWGEANQQFEAIIARFGEAGDLNALKQRLVA